VLDEPADEEQLRLRELGEAFSMLSTI
jgi:hypothetical protein